MRQRQSAAIRNSQSKMVASLAPPLCLAYFAREITAASIIPGTHLSKSGRNIVKGRCVAPFVPCPPFSTPLIIAGTRGGCGGSAIHSLSASRPPFGLLLWHPLVSFKLLLVLEVGAQLNKFPTSEKISALMTALLSQLTHTLNLLLFRLFPPCILFSLFPGGFDPPGIVGLKKPGVVQIGDPFADNDSRLRP